MYGYTGKFIVLQREEVKKLAKFFKEELGITNIRTINGEGGNVELTTFDEQLPLSLVERPNGASQP